MKKKNTLLNMTLLIGLSATVLCSCGESAVAEKTDTGLPEETQTEISSEDQSDLQSEIIEDQEVEASTDEMAETAVEMADQTVSNVVSSSTKEQAQKAASNVLTTKKETTAALSEAKEKVQNIEQSTLQAAQNKIAEPAKAQTVAEFSHDTFNALLTQYVTSTGKVNYSGFKGNANFKTYLNDLSANEPDASWSKNKKLAYWINAYNAFTIQLITDNYPVKSITDLSGGKPWDKKFITIGGKSYSLNDIEHGIIRKQFNEPRIHFACVCAAKSCPKLLNQAYTEAKLNSQLTAQTKYFINDASRNQIADKNLKVSKLFEWYAGDFGEVNAYIAKYYNGTFKPDSQIEFMDYDWSLNN